MRTPILLALCALFALNAEARTIYVNAKRPNNKGNGLSVKKAKKTIQAAINVAKKGDTILVLPGTYAPIQTNNKIIAIKSRKGKKKTFIGAPARGSKTVWLVRLGTTQKKQEASGGTHVTRILPTTKGTKTALSGFTIDGMGAYGYDGMGMTNDADKMVGVSGGTLKSCTLRNIVAHYYDEVIPCYTVVANSSLKKCLIQNNNAMGMVSETGEYVGGLTINSKLASCTIRTNNGPIANSTLTACAISDIGGSIFGSKLNRCTVRNSHMPIQNTTLCNCLVAGNSSGACLFVKSKLYNCTIADNLIIKHYGQDGAWGRLSMNSKFFNSICWNNRLCDPDIWLLYGATDPEGGVRWIKVWDNVADELCWTEFDPTGYILENVKEASGSFTLGEFGRCDRFGENETVEDFHYTMLAEIDNSMYSPCNSSSGNTYKNTNTKTANPKFVSAAKGNYKLKKGSYCIDKGKLPQWLKKQVGTKDLAGRKRIKGKAIDRGCYEY